MAELTQGLRLVRRQPVLHLTMLLTLATGLGLANVGFALTDAMFFSELPGEHGAQFVRIDVNDPRTGRGDTMDLERFQLLEAEATTLEFLGAKDHEQLNVFNGSGEVEQVTGVAISPGAFAFLSASPLVGRTLVTEDGGPGAPPTVVIRESLWESRFDRRPDVVGAALNIDGVVRAIVGVLPDTFEFPNSPRVWVPLDGRYLGGTADGMLAGNELFGVRAPGATLEAARQQIERLSEQYELTRPEAPERVLTILPYTREATTMRLWAVMGPFVSVLVLVLLVIAFNVGNLVMVRTASRANELAVRSALGASRARMVAQLFGEVALMVGVATAIGLLASSRALEWFRWPCRSPSSARQ